MKGGESSSRLLGSIVSMGSATALSRITGYLRDRVVAHLLGTSFYADAFYIAFRIPNTFRRFVAEGAMTAAMVPVFSECQKKEPEKLWEFGRAFFYTYSFILLCLTAIGVLISPLLAHLMAWKYAVTQPAIFSLTIDLTRLMFPYIFLVSISAVAMGYLNSFNIFAVPALSPILLNLSVVAAGLIASRFFNGPASTIVLSLGVLIGGFLQIILQIPYLLKIGMSFKWTFSFKDEMVRRVFTKMIPGMLGAGMAQITLLVGTAMANKFGEGAVTALYYANRVNELAFGILAVSVSTVILPSLSRQASVGDFDSMKKTLLLSLRAIFFILLPATSGLIALNYPVIEVLFKTGRFDSYSVALTTGPLIGYTLGMVLWGIVQVLNRVFYAMQDMVTPFYISMVTFLAFLLSSILLMPAYAHSAIAAGSSISAFINAILLYIFLNKRIPSLPLNGIISSLLRCSLLSLAMGIVAFLLFRTLPHANSSISALSLIVTIIVSAIFYFSSAYLFKFKEINLIVDFIWKKKQ